MLTTPGQLGSKAGQPGSQPGQEQELRGSDRGQDGSHPGQFGTTSGHSAAPIYPQWTPPEAARVLETWGRLPPAVKQAIVARIEAVDESATVGLDEYRH